MSYTVLARRYRSAAFDEVVGQEPIAKTLQNAIASGRIAHAYLFTGTRGVGKTSMARIFARALNAPDTIPGCPKPPDEAPDAKHPGKGAAKSQPYEYPPEDVQQRMADAIMRGDDLNVIEIDGASNNSVENARQLIGNAGLAPSGNARFKIYIIDEVHMLSNAAFNALLKTMEEPPAHVKFILCTTEAHKVPATIQSRCQRFDFRNIPTPRIVDHLRAVLKKEKLKADEEVFWQLARLGNGSMRDALSLLDRVIATGEQPLTPDTLVRMLGLPPQEMVVALVDACAAGDVEATLERTAALLDQGIAQDQLSEVLIERLRQLMLIHACGVRSELVELSDDARAAAAEQAQRFDVPALVYMIALCENLQRQAKSSSNPRALLDATVVRLALAEKLADVAGLLSGSAAKGGGSAPAAVGVRTPVAAGEKKVTEGAPRSAAAPAATAPAPRPAPSPPSLRVPPPASPPSGSAPPPRLAAPVSPATDATGPGGGSGGGVALDGPGLWARLLQDVADKPSMSWLRALELRRFENGVAQLAPQAGQRDVARFASYGRDQIARLFSTLAGRPIRVELLMTPPSAAVEANDLPTDAPAQGTADAAAQPGPPGPPAMTAQQALALPLVKQVMELFDVTLLEVRPEQIARAADSAPADAAPGPKAPAAPPRPPRPAPSPERDGMEDDPEA